MKFFKNFYYLIFPLFFFLIYFTIDYVYVFPETWMKIVTSIIIAYLLSPRTRIVNKQNSKVKIIKWIFLRNAVFVRLRK